MDEVVLKAMAKWPDVPAVFGWLGLDNRGRWRIKGELVSNPQAVAFISRNYAVDARGRWYFQNGPQRVFVALEYTPWVLRLRGDGALETHTGQLVAHPDRAFVDEEGSLLLSFERGIGVVEDRDLERLSEGVARADGKPIDAEQLAQALECLDAPAAPALDISLAGRHLGLSALKRCEVADRFGFQPSPDARA